jgi:hypothetical protein
VTRVSESWDLSRRDAELPLIGRFLPAPLAAKVPEVILLFWVVKILTTAGGEATSDYLKTYGNFGGGGLEVLVIVVGLALQFGARRYRAFAYWSSQSPKTPAGSTSATAPRRSCSPPPSSSWSPT